MFVLRGLNHYDGSDMFVLRGLNHYDGSDMFVLRGLNHYDVLLDCSAYEPLWHAIFSTTSSSFDFWSRSCSATRL